MRLCSLFVLSMKSVNADVCFNIYPMWMQEQSDFSVCQYVCQFVQNPQIFSTQPESGLQYELCSHQLAKEGNFKHISEMSIVVLIQSVKKLLNELLLQSLSDVCFMVCHGSSSVAVFVENNSCQADTLRFTQSSISSTGVSSSWVSSSLQIRTSISSAVGVASSLVNHGGELKEQHLSPGTQPCPSQRGSSSMYFYLLQYYKVIMHGT